MVGVRGRKKAACLNQDKRLQSFREGVPGRFLNQANRYSFQSCSCKLIKWDVQDPLRIGPLGFDATDDSDRFEIESAAQPNQPLLFDLLADVSALPFWYRTFFQL